MSRTTLQSSTTSSFSSCRLPNIPCQTAERSPTSMQVSSMRGKVGVLDLVARFRVRNLIIVIFKAILIFKGKGIMVPIQVRNMSGYVTVYTDLSPSSTTGVSISQNCTTGKSSSGAQLYHGANRQRSRVVVKQLSPTAAVASSLSSPSSSASSRGLGASLR